MTRDDIIRMAREVGCPETATEGVFRVNSDDLGRFAALIATANPAAITELLDRLEAAEKETKSLREGLKRMCLDEDADAKEAKALRAEIAEMEKQEPVKHEFQGRDGTWHSFLDQRHYENTVADGRWPVRALYALPGAQPAPSVPEGFALVNKAHFLAVLDREDWRTAKNRAELRAMLAAAPSHEENNGSI